MGREKYSKTYIRDNKKRKRENAAIMDEKIKRMAENKMDFERRYGTYPDLIIMGQEERINGDAFRVFEDESMKLSYSYGYYEKASKLLEGLFFKGVFDEEKQKEFGMLDVINEIPQQYIKNLKQYPAYLEGRIYQMGKNAYDFTLNNGLSFEDYVNIMSIIQQEVNSSIFKEGYNARRIESNLKKQK